MAAFRWTGYMIFRQDKRKLYVLDSPVPSFVENPKPLFESLYERRTLTS